MCKSRKKVIQFSLTMARVCLECKVLSDYDPIEEVKERKCLCCDKKFLSKGNRKCDTCNSYYHDDVYSNISSFVSVGF